MATVTNYSSHNNQWSVEAASPCSWCRLRQLRSLSWHNSTTYLPTKSSWAQSNSTALLHHIHRQSNITPTRNMKTAGLHEETVTHRQQRQWGSGTHVARARVKGINASSIRNMIVDEVRIMPSRWFGLVLCVSSSALTRLNDMNGVCSGPSTISVNDRKDIKPIKTHSTDSQRLEENVRGTWTMALNGSSKRHTEVWHIVGVNSTENHQCFTETIESNKL